jgi:hypothetical protein
MAFSNGTVSTRRFFVSGKNPKLVDQDLLDKLAACALVPNEESLPEEVDYGWCGGRHVLDSKFTFEHNVFNDALSFALRVDTNKMPADLKKAYQIMEEEAIAAGNPSGFISKLQKKGVKESVGQKIDDELRSGKFRRSKMTPILWDLPTQTLYSPASGATAEKLMELFERCFGLTLEPMTAGTIALSIVEPAGKRRDYEDLRPTRFVYGPDGESQYPEYPWTAKGPQPKDFLGNEFLLWLWHAADHRDGAVMTESAGEVTVFFDKSLDLHCAYGQTGKDSLRGDGPVRMPEARDGLRTGKVPRKAGLILDAKRQQFTVTLAAEDFGFSAAKLPEIEDADTPRTLFEERVSLLRDLSKSVDALYETFLKARCSSAWESQTSAIRKWIMQSAKPVAAVA